MILYKYMPLARMDFWKTFLLRFTQPSAFNDPFDCLPSYSFLPNSLMPQNSGYGELASLFMGIENETVNFNDDHTVFCMSEDWNSILMWAHYADSHKGFVVGFDVSHPFFALGEPYGTKKVIYCSNRPKFTSVKISEELYYKLNVWEYEKEWRLTKNTYEASEVINSSVYLYRMPEESIRCVYCGICMPKEIKKQLNEIAKKLGIPCYQVMRDYQTFELHAILLQEHDSMQAAFLDIQKDLLKEEVPSTEPDKNIPSKIVIRTCLEKLAWLINYFVAFFVSNTNGSYVLKSEYIAKDIKLYQEYLCGINCFPGDFQQCDKTISRQIYEDKIKLIGFEFGQSVYSANRILNIIQKSMQGILPKTEWYLSTQIREKIGAAASSFASAIAWAALILDYDELQKILVKATFDERFELITADNNGFRLGKKILADWYQMKQQAIMFQNEQALKKYVGTRTSFVCIHTGASEHTVNQYIQKYCPYIQGKLPERKEIPRDYKGKLTLDQQRRILDLCFFMDTVQANGGFKAFEGDPERKAREEQRIRKALLDAGMSIQDVNQYIELFV